MDLERLVRKYGADACIGCGRCTYSCVAAQRYEGFSPRSVVENALNGKQVKRTAALWACTACGACSQLCNADVDFPGLVRELRAAGQKDNVPLAAHHGVLGRVAKLSSSSAPQAAAWVTPDLELDEGSDTLLFVGCTPYFDVVFNYFRSDLLEIPRASVRLLNALDIRPRLLSSERCCGHDAFWSGDDALFDRLARANVDAVKAAGIKEIMAFCPECLVTWRDLYPQILGDTGIRVRSVMEVVQEGLCSGRLDLRKGEELFTYQDPCRLSKGTPVIEAPRHILRTIGRLEDMPRSGVMSACCGTAGWVNCDHTAKKVQMERLNEAESTRADTLITACPKCLIHLSCADRHHGAEMPRRIRIEDIHVRAARALER